MKKHFKIILVCGLSAVLIFSSSVFSGIRQKPDSPEIHKQNSPENRLALVIGNADYKEVPALKNPVNDARDIADTLKQVGFEVIQKENAGHREMEEALDDFGKQLGRRGGVGLFYFAGHGMQSDGRNYLIPVDAKIGGKSDLKFKTVDAGVVLGKMEDAENMLNIIILDACRNNPFERAFGTRGIYSVGLAKMDAPAGSIIAYATSPDKTASDGGTERNGVYTRYLLKHIKTPGLTIEKVLKNTRIDVAGKTSNQQIPWEHSSLMGDFYFAGSGGAAVSEPAVSARPETNPEPAPPSVEITKPKSEPVPVSVPAAKPEPESTTETAPAGRKISNSIGMEFVYIPPGTFMMGSSENDLGRGDDEKQHRVTLTQGFYMQTAEATQGQWKAVMGNNPSHFRNCGDDCPVERVSWNDVQEFIKKLNRKEGKNYRLPTEAEWEYACRSGTTAAYSFGNDSGKLTKYARFNENSGRTTHPAAQLEPNAWGLYDMHGNVGEWCQDIYNKDIYNKNQTDPIHIRWSSDSLRVVRGGSFFFGMQNCRSAYRNNSPPDNRHGDVGFRLVLSSGQQR
jgi:formylglycine-generating enzyme required for sulfatase activity